MAGDLATQNQSISEHIREYGWHCLHIFPTEAGQDNFSYSVGFAESYGAPEVLVFGLAREKAHALLSECARLLNGGQIIQPGFENPDVLSGGYKVVFKPLRAKCYGDYVGTALRYYQGRPFSAVVMFLPNREHRFPWQPAYDYIRAAEPLAIV